MSGVFRNIDPPPPHRPASVYPPPASGAGGGHTRWVMRGWGSIVNSSEDARHCKYFVVSTLTKDIFLLNLNFRHFHKMCSVNMLSFLFSAYNYTYIFVKKHFKFYLQALLSLCADPSLWLQSRLPILLRVHLDRVKETVSHKI